MLFPYSDLDILFLFENEKSEAEFRPFISEFSRTMWDLGFRVSSAGRTIDECKRIEEDNAEFHLALLDRRYLAGDESLFDKLDKKVLPPSEKQARPFLFSQLHRLTKERLARYGNTIFHLEPNVKEAPGGLRDYQAAFWLRQIIGDSPDLRGLSAADEEMAGDAVEFQSSIRCLLHYGNARNDNTLTYEMQEEAAKRSLAVRDGIERERRGMDAPLFPTRAHAEPATTSLPRSKNVLSRFHLRERLFSAARIGYAPARSPRRGAHFAIRSGQFEILDQPALADRSIIYSLFIEAARTGTPLSRDTERIINYVVCHSELPAMNQVMSWDDLEGNSCRRLSGNGAAANAPPGTSDGDSAGDAGDRFAGGSRFLSPLYSRRTFAPYDRTFAGTCGTARCARNAIRSDLENAGAARSFDFRFATSRHRQRHAGGKSRSRQSNGAGKRRFATGTDARGRSRSAVSD